MVRTAPWFSGPELGLQGPILPPPVEPSLPSPTSTALSLGGSKHGATSRERLGRGLAGTTGQRRGLRLLSLLLLLHLSLHPPHASSSAGCPAHGPPPNAAARPRQLHCSTLGAAGWGSGVSSAAGGCPCLEGTLVRRGSAQSRCLEELSRCRRAPLQTAVPRAAHPRKLVRCRRACLFLLFNVCAFSS